MRTPNLNARSVRGPSRTLNGRFRFGSGSNAFERVKMRSNASERGEKLPPNARFGSGTGFPEPERRTRCSVQSGSGSDRFLNRTFGILPATQPSSGWAPPRVERGAYAMSSNRLGVDIRI